MTKIPLKKYELPPLFSPQKIQKSSQKIQKWPHRFPPQKIRFVNYEFFLYFWDYFCFFWGGGDFCIIWENFVLFGGLLNYLRSFLYFLGEKKVGEFLYFLGGFLYLVGSFLI
jgi:hypothetical protein